MKTSSFIIYLLKILFHKKGMYFLIIALFVAIFCLPIIASFAHYSFLETDYYQGIKQQIGFNFQTKIKTMKIYTTAYSSTAEETDDTPCTAASGYNLCQHNEENVVACNFLPFGTQVRFPDLDPEKIYTVVDRMHERFNSRMDIWKRSKTEAKKFGVKYLNVEILQPHNATQH